MNSQHGVATTILFLPLVLFPSYGFSDQARRHLSPEKALIGHWICTKLDADIEDHEVVEELHYYFSDSLATRMVYFGGSAAQEREAPNIVTVGGNYRISGKGDDWLKLKIRRLGIKEIIFSQDRNTFQMKSVGTDFGEEFQFVDNGHDP
ncbi:MAG: hypothetical protein PHN82_09385 [bacterium]|nr:hypothetical protein [bacterium]